MNLINLLDAFRKGGNETPFVSLKGQRAHIEAQFERYGIDMVDVLQLFKQNNLQVKPHSTDPDLNEIYGQTVDGEDMALIVCTNGYTIKVIDVWLVE